MQSNFPSESRFLPPLYQPEDCNELIHLEWTIDDGIRGLQFNISLSFIFFQCIFVDECTDWEMLVYNTSWDGSFTLIIQDVKANQEVGCTSPQLAWLKSCVRLTMECANSHIYSLRKLECRATVARCNEEVIDNSFSFGLCLVTGESFLSI